MHPATDKPPSAPDESSESAFGARYEWTAVSLLALGFGLVGLDRFIINPLFPVMAKDLGLSYSDLGLIAGALALTWGLSAIFCGNLADRLGPKRVVVPAIVIFSLLAAFTGLATGLGTLLLIRGIMGVSEGAFMPAGIVATTRASAPRRIGLNNGIAMAAVGAFGLGIGPVLATRLLHVVPSWHWVFVLVAPPGLVLAFVLQRVLRERPVVPRAAKVEVPSLRAVLAHRNVLVAAACAGCWLSAMTTLQAFMPNYLTDHLDLSLDVMGVVMGGMGIGSVVGMIGLAALSDRLGRRRVMIGAVLVDLLVMALLIPTGARPVVLFALLLVQSLTTTGLIVITVGPVATQSVPPLLAAGASGLVMGVGEIVGGALAPGLAGGLANSQGIQMVLPFALVMLVIGLVITVTALREPAQQLAADAVLVPQAGQA